MRDGSLGRRLFAKAAVVAGAFLANPYFVGAPAEGDVVSVNVGTVGVPYDSVEVKITSQADGSTVMDWTAATTSSLWALTSTVGKTLIPQARAKLGGVIVATSGLGAAFGPMAVVETLVFACAFNNSTQSVGLAGAIQFSQTTLTTANAPQYTVNPNTNLGDPWYKHGFGGTVFVSSGFSITASGQFNNKLDGRVIANGTMGQCHLAVELMKGVHHKFYAGATATAAAATANMHVNDGATGGPTLVAVPPQTVDDNKILDAAGNNYDGSTVGAANATNAYTAWQNAGGGIYGGVGVDIVPSSTGIAASGDNPAKCVAYIGKDSGSTPNIGWIAITRGGGTGLTVRPSGAI